MTGPADTPDAGDDEPATAELVRLGETAIANQNRMFELHLGQARHLLSLSGGVLLVAVAIAGFAAPRRMGSFFGLVDSGVLGFVVLLVISFSASFTAAICFVRVYVGSRRRPVVLLVGWDPSKLLMAALEKDPLEKIRKSTLLGIKRWSLRNEEMLKRSARLIRIGTWSLSLGGTSLALGLIYALGAVQ